MHTFHQKEAHLKEHGFEFVRSVKHGSIWSDGISRITVSRSTKHAHEFLKQVKKAVVLKQGIQDKPPVLPVSTRPVASLGDLPGFQKILSERQPETPGNRRVLIVASPPHTPPAPEPEEDVKPRPYMRLDPDVRYLLFLRVEELMNADVGQTEIARILNEEGARLPDGSPLPKHWVNNTMRQIRAGQIPTDPSLTLPATEDPAPVSPPPAPEVVMKSIVAPLAVPKVQPNPIPVEPSKIPDFAHKILREATLTPEQRLKLLRTYAEIQPLSGLFAAILSEPLKPDQTFRMLQVYGEL